MKDDEINLDKSIDITALVKNMLRFTVIIREEVLSLLQIGIEKYR